MSKVSPLINNFSGGEWGPLASARVDLDRYKTSTETCLNYIPVLQGGLTRRPGTKYVGLSKNGSVNNIRLIPFIFAKDDAYVIEIALGAFRFYKNNAQVLNGGSPFEVAHSYTSAQLPQLKFCQSNDILYIFHSEVAPKKLIRFSNTSWSLSALSLNDGPYQAWQSQAAAFDVDVLATHAITNSAITGAVTLQTRTMNVTGAVSSGGLIKLTIAGTGHGVLSGDRIYVTGVGGTVEANGTWQATYVDATHLTLDGSVFVNAYTAGGTTRFAPFTSTDVGRWFSQLDGTPRANAIITAFTNGGNVTATVYNPYTTTTAKTYWQLGVYSTTNGYPVSGCFHEDRLWMFGPGQYLAGSNVGDYENFAPTLAAGTTTGDTGILAVLNSNDSNNAQWIVSDEKGLLAGTDANEWLIKSSSTTSAITSSTATAKQVTSFGSKNISPVQAGKAVLFAQTSGRKVREFNYFYDVDGFRCTDLTQLAHHIGESGIIEMALQKQPYSLVWCVRADGTLACLTYERDVEGLKVAWHKHQLGGRSDLSHTTYGKVLSIAVIPSANGNYDELWMAVDRYVNDTNDVCIEYLSPFFDSEVEQEDAFFVDCGLTYDSPKTVTLVDLDDPIKITTSAAHGWATGNLIRFDNLLGTTQLNGNIYKIVVTAADSFTLQDRNGNDINDSAGTYGDYIGTVGEVRKLVTTISGLSHLNSLTVSMLGDGAVLDDAVVSGGSVTLSAASGVVQIGIKYNSDVKLPRLEAGSRDGTSLGKTRRTHRIGFMLDRSLGLQFGESFDDLMPMQFQDANDNLNQAPALFSGIKSEEFTCDSNMENKICFRQNEPLPSTILAVMPQMVTEDR